MGQFRVYAIRHPFIQQRPGAAQHDIAALSESLNFNLARLVPFQLIGAVSVSSTLKVFYEPRTRRSLVRGEGIHTATRRIKLERH